MTLVTIPQAAERAVVHPQTVRRWIREGRLHPYRLAEKGGVKATYLILSAVLEVERERRHARHAGNRGPRRKEIA